MGALLFGAAPVLSAQTPYILIEAETLTGQPDTTFTDLNDVGQIVGYYAISSTRDNAFVWQSGRSTRLPQMPDGISTRAVGINAHGQIVGSSSATYQYFHAVTWIDGDINILDPAASSPSWGDAINDLGHIAGRYYEFGTNNGVQPFIRAGEDLDFFYDNAASVSITTLNTRGTTGGSVQVQSGEPPRGWFRTSGLSNPRFVGISGSPQGTVNDINASDQATGGSVLPAGGGLTHAFRYERTDGFTTVLDLNPPGAWQSNGHVITDDGTVYGWVQFDANEDGRIAQIDGADTIDISGATIGADAWNLRGVIARNNAGWLLGSGLHRDDIFNVVHYLLLPREAATSVFSNLSVRANLTAHTPLIVGTVATGGAREVLVRGIGPGLSPYVTDTPSLAADPRLAVFDSSQNQQTANDNWGGTPELIAAVTASQSFPLDPASLDAMALATISGPTSAHVTDDAAGLALIELYDLSVADADNRLTNLSARYEVGTGSNILIAGFIISGSGAKTVLVRGIGPGLEAFDVAGALDDPQITILDSAGNIIARNDDWSSNLGSVFTAAGAFELAAGSKDAALVLPLWPGAYTVHLSGVAQTTGQGLIEIYDLDL